jgi:hypothetical protein
MKSRFLLVLALVGALLGCGRGTASAETEMSPKAFREFVIAHGQHVLPDAQFRRIDDETVEVVRPGGASTRLSLKVAYVEYLRAPEGPEVIADALIAALREGEVAADVTRLVAILRPAGHNVEVGSKGRGLITRPFVGDLLQVLAIDSEESISYATAEVLGTLGLTEDQAWAQARENLPERIGRLDIGAMEDAEEFVAVNSESGLAPSSLLLPSACAQGASGRPLLVLARHFFIMPANAEPQTTQAFWNLARYEATNPDRFSGKVIVCSDGRWTVAEPPTS